MALNNIIASRQQVENTKGVPIAGGSVFLYIPGTTTFITSYKDSGLVNPHTNPVRLSASGRANIWISRDCDLRIEDRLNNLVLTEDNVNPDSLGAENDSGLVPNGSFEIDADADLIPDGWTLVSEASSTNEIDSTESTDGANSFRFTSTGFGGGSLTVTDFFPVNDVDDLRVNVDLRSTVAAVRNIVRVEWYDISLVSISNSDPYDSTTNPTSFTTQNLLVTPPANARFAKLRLIGIDPSVLLSGSTYFDRVQVFYPAVVSGIFDNITIQNNEIITTNANGDLNLRPNGTGSVVVDHNGNPVARSGADQFRVLTDIVTATPPGVEAVTGEFAIFDQDNDDELMVLGFDGSNALHVGNRMEAGVLRLDTINAASAAIVSLEVDPDGGSYVRHSALKRIETQADGTLALRADDDVANNTILLRLAFADDTLQALFGFTAASDDNLLVENVRSNGEIHLRASDGGTPRNYVEIDPDLDQIRIGFGGTERFRFNAIGVSDVQFSAQIADPGGTLRPVGMGVMPIVEEDGDVTINTAANMGTYVHRDAGTPGFDVDQETTVPLGAWWKVVNDAGSTMEIEAIAGVNVVWMDGAGAQVVTRGNGSPFTLAIGAVVTLFKYTDIEYHLYGDGIS